MNRTPQSYGRFRYCGALLQNRPEKTLLLVSAVLILATILLCGAAAADAAAVTTEEELRAAVATDNFNVVLGADISLASALSIETTGTLDLNGYTLRMTGVDTVIRVSAGGNLTLDDSSSDKTGLITGGNAIIGGGVFVSGKDSTFTMNGGTIAENSAKYGGGVYVAYGRFTMNGGCVRENVVDVLWDKGAGGGVAVVSGTFTMYDGIITSNTAVTGSGVFVSGKDSTFTMYKGHITENTATEDGGGVCVIYGTFIMNDGHITGNCGEIDGGGVSVAYGTVILNNGVISGNSSEWGGGVYVFDGTFTMNNGVISENSSDWGGGVYSYKSVFNRNGGEISGDVVVISEEDEEDAVPFKDGEAKLEHSSIIDSVSTKNQNVVGLVSVHAAALPKPSGTIDGRKITVIGNAFTLQLSSDSEFLYPVTGVGASLNGKLLVSSIQGSAEKLCLAQKTDGGGWKLLPVKNPKISDKMWVFTVDFTSTENGHYAFVIAEPKPSKSSTSRGTSIWLTATPTSTPVATAAPTAVPTSEMPTVKPTAQPTQSGASPAPFIGILAGLGAAAVLFAVRRT